MRKNEMKAIINRTINEEGFAVCGACVEFKIPTMEISSHKIKVPLDRYCDNCSEGGENEPIDQLLLREAVRTEYIEYFLEDAGVPQRYLNCSFKNFEGEELEDLPAYIYGPPGCGKTHLAVACLRQVIKEEGEHAGFFLRTRDLFSEIQNSFQEGSSADWTHLIKKYGEKIPFLVIDDLGIEKMPDLVDQTIFYIIDNRFDKMLKTTITSSFTLSQHAEHHGVFGNRLASRIASMGPRLHLGGNERRWEG